MSTSSNESPTIPKEVFDLAGLRERVENDMDLVAELIDLYLSTSPQLMAELESAVAGGDGEKVTRAAHTLKGVLKNMCAASCAEAALELEMMGNDSNLNRAGETLQSLRNEYQHLQSVLTAVATEIKV